MLASALVCGLLLYSHPVVGKELDSNPAIGNGNEVDGTNESFVCPNGRWKCGDNNVCRPRWQRCDGHVDCSDKSDEEGCASYTCSDGYVKCGGESKDLCVDKFDRCNGRNGRYACGKQGDDEMDCDTFTCPKGFVKCGGDNRDLCVDEYLRCNGRNDRAENVCGGQGGDEMDCESYDCPHEREKCADGKVCMEPWQKCDGHGHCPDKTDEEGCDTFTCHDGFVKCGGDNKDLCVDKFDRCNGKNDRHACGGQGDDEMDCAKPGHNSLATRTTDDVIVWTTACVAGLLVMFAAIA